MLTFAFMHYSYLVCILFGMPSLHLFTFLMFKSCFCTFLMLISVTVRPMPKKNISSVTTTPELETALTVRLCTSLASRPMTVVFGLGTRLRVRMRTKLENGVLSNGQQPQSVVNGFC